MPVVRSSAARFARATPPRLVKSPPSHTVVSTGANTRTGAFGCGFQAVAAPPDVATAPPNGRGCPPSVPKVPPTYIVEPLSRRETTVLSAPGFHEPRVDPLN